MIPASWIVNIPRKKKKKEKKKRKKKGESENQFLNNNNIIIITIILTSLNIIDKLMNHQQYRPKFTSIFHKYLSKYIKFI